MRWAALAVAGLLVLPGCGGVPDVLQPPRGGGFDYQLGGAYPTAAGVGIVVRDREDPADPALYSVCYVNAFQTQPGDTSIPGELLLRDADGDPVEDPAWPGEFLLDISSEDDREALLQVVGGWIDGCAAHGFEAVEPDNLDSWTRSGGLLDRADAVAMARLLVDRAHAAGLAVAQKNAAELADDDLGFDLAITEDCAAFDECDVYAAAYDVVLDVEYGPCDAAPEQVRVLRRDLALTTPGTPGYVFEECGS
ncbi:endo alpha-1,4 polygalactosaminidase [Geodermatophilus sp. SYSU D00691]